MTKNIFDVEACRNGIPKNQRETGTVYMQHDIQGMVAYNNNAMHNPILVKDVAFRPVNVGSSPIVGAIFSVMKAEYVVVAEQAHRLGPAYSLSQLFLSCRL